MDPNRDGTLENTSPLLCSALLLTPSNLMAWWTLIHRCLVATPLGLYPEVSTPSDCEMDLDLPWPSWL